MIDRLPTLAPEEIRELITDRETIRAAQRGVFQLQAIARKLTPASFAAIARQQYRTEPLSMAIALLAHEIDRAAQEIEDHAQRSEQAKQEEAARSAQIVGTATRRLFALMEAIPQLEKAIHNAEHSHTQRRQKLITAGMSADEVARYAPAANVGEMIANLDAARVEAVSLEQYLSTRDESLLPPGFVPCDPVKVQAPQPKLEVPAYLRA